jgi:hypothetical protein
MNMARLNWSSIGKRQAFYNWVLVSILLFTGCMVWPSEAAAQLRATARPDTSSTWNRGIQQISPETYYDAIECGKQGGEDPPCVFWDTGLCQNDDFVLAAYTGYKQVAYEVWVAVQKQQPAPQPNYQAARRTRVTIGVTPARGATNALTDLVLKRRGAVVRPVDRSVRGGQGRFVFDYTAWAPSATVTLDMVGEERTISCVIEPTVLQQFR